MWIQPLFLTLQLMAVSVTIAAVVGIVGAWAASSLEGENGWRRWICGGFLVCLLISVAMPMILHAAAWESTVGKFGWMMITQSGARAIGTGPYGFFGGLVACSWVHGLVGASLVALATWHGVRNTPSVLIQQSRLELGVIAAWWRVRLPIAMPWLVASLLATAALAATEMTVVDLYGFRTLADEFYLFYAADPSIASVLATCFVPMSMAGVALTWLFVSRRRLAAFQQDHQPVVITCDEIPRSAQILMVMILILVSALIVLIPISGLIVKLGHEVAVEEGQVRASWSLWSCLQRLVLAPRDFAHEYKWTTLIATLTAATAVAIAWPLAALARTHRRLEVFIDLTTIVLIAIPGPIVGLVVVSAFQWDVPGFRTLYQQTLVPTILALLVRSGPVAYWVLRSGYRGIDAAVLQAALLDGPWWRRMWSIDRPLLSINLAAAILASAVVSSGDVPATLPVIPPGVATVGTRLFGLLHSGARYQEAALAIWYLAAVVLITLFWFRQRIRSRVTVV